MNTAPTLVAARTALPPKRVLRLRPGKAGSAAPAGGEETPTPAAARAICGRGAFLKATRSRVL